MLIQVTNPEGLEIPVDALQKALHDHLVSIWELTDTKIKAYGIADKMRDQTGYIPVFFDAGTSKDYTRLDWDDRLAVQFFFIQGDESSISNSNYDTEVSVVLTVNLDQLATTSDINRRGDAIARKNVFDFLNHESYGFRLESEQKGVENCLREFAGLVNDELLIKMDMHPIHSFRFDMSITFKP